MMYGRIKSRLMASALAAALAPAALVATTVALPSQARADDEVDLAKCGIHAVLASKEGDRGIPKELAAFKAQLSEDEFAIYKSFYLIEQKALDLRVGKKTEAKFRSGNRISMTLLGNDDTRLKLQLDLSNRDETKQLLSMKLSVVDGAVVIARAGPVEHQGVSGMLFFINQCART